MTNTPVPKTLPKTLIVAANVSSKFGGEAFLPLKYFQLMRDRGYPVKLVTHARNRADLAEALPLYMDDIFFIEDTIWHQMAWGIGQLFPGRVAENLTRIILERIDAFYQTKPINALIADGHVDLIHQPIPVSPLSPSNLHRFGKPLIIGPMNGNMNFPQGYNDYERATERLMLNLTRKLAPAINRLSPGKHHARALIVANQRTRDALDFLPHAHVIELVENGVDLELFEHRRTTKPSQPGRLQLVYMGRLPDWKALDITLHAISKARTSGADITLDILGDGSQRRRLEKLILQLDLDQHVRFQGFLPQEKCAEFLRVSDALILNSLRECGGAVVLEAMSVGLPVIVSDWGGPADYVDPSCGMLVHPVPRQSFADRLADAMVRLANDIDLRTRMGDAGVQKVRAQFDWNKKVDMMLGIYADALSGKRSGQPSPELCKTPSTGDVSGGS